METYKIIRFYRGEMRSPTTIKGGLTLEQARAHCRDPETSSLTCTLKEGRHHTYEYGHWFDGYDIEKRT